MGYKLNMDEFGFNESKPLIQRLSLMSHILNRINKLEQSTKGIVALQFASHPEGLAMTIRIFVPATEKEYSYPDVIVPAELVERDLELSRIDILFDCIHDALNKVQVVSSQSGGLIHKL